MIAVVVVEVVVVVEMAGVVSFSDTLWFLESKFTRFKSMNFIQIKGNYKDESVT